MQTIVQSICQAGYPCISIYQKKRFTPTSHSKRLKSPAVKALRTVRGAFDISPTSHCPLTYQEIKLYLSC